MRSFRALMDEVDLSAVARSGKRRPDIQHERLSDPHVTAHVRHKAVTIPRKNFRGRKFGQPANAASCRTWIGALRGTMRSIKAIMWSSSCEVLEDGVFAR